MALKKIAPVLAAAAALMGVFGDTAWLAVAVGWLIYGEVLPDDIR